MDINIDILHDCFLRTDKRIKMDINIDILQDCFLRTDKRISFKQDSDR